MSTYHNLLGMTVNGVFVPIGNGTLNSGLTLFTEASGTVPRAPGYIAVNECKPLLSIDTPALETMYTALGGLYGLNTSKEIKLYFAKAEHGGFDHADECEVMTCPSDQAVFAAKSVTAAQGGAARMTWDFYGVYSGSNYPFTRGSTVSLPSTTAILNQLYTCGKVHDGVALRDVTSINVDFGIQMEQLSCNGSPYPDTVRCRYWAPTATADFTDAGYVRSVIQAAATSVPGFVTTNDVKFCFQKVDVSTPRVATNVASHFIVTFPEKTMISEAGNPSTWGTVAPTRIQFTAGTAGSNPAWYPVSVSAAAVYPT